MNCGDCFLFCNSDCCCPIVGEIRGGYENCNITQKQFSDFTNKVTTLMQEVNHGQRDKFNTGSDNG